MLTKSFQEFKNIEHAGNSAKHHHQVQSARGDTPGIAGEWNKCSSLVVVLEVMLGRSAAFM